MNSVQNISTVQVDKRTNLSRRELVKEYIEPERPVILTDAAKNWEAIGKFTPQFFKDNYAHIGKEIGGIYYKMTEFIDLMLSSTPEKPAPYPYNFNVEKFFPELLEYMRPEILYAKSDRVNNKLTPKFMFGNTHKYEIFLGGNGARWPTLHIDLLFLHNQMTQLYGSKTFYFYPPDQTPFLYANPAWPKKSLVNIFNPDHDKFPLFKNAQCIKATVEQGETILSPKGWWHTTEMTGPCISLGRVQLNASNWNEFVKDNYEIWKSGNKKMRVPALMYSTLLGHVMNIQEFFSR
jgi:histone arginine demethylase JMJD6